MMKRFLTKVLIVGLVVAAALFSIEMYVRSIPNEYSYKYNYMENHIDSIRILAVGSSIGRSGIDPRCFNEKTFNVANVSQDLETDCAIIDKYLPRADKLHTVIFTLLPGSFCSRMGEGIESWRLRKYAIYMDLDIEKPKFSERLEISNMSSAYVQVSKHLRGINTVECDELGMGKDSIVASENAKIKQAESISKIHNSLYIPSNYGIIVPRVESSITKCQKYGIKVYMILLPVHKAYSDRIDAKMLAECDSIARELSNKHSNVEYINMFVDSTFISDDFRNSNHLSQQGAKKLSNKLNELIIK